VSEPFHRGSVCLNDSQKVSVSEPFHRGSVCLTRGDWYYRGPVGTSSRSTKFAAESHIIDTGIGSTCSIAANAP
jgi:hypothetical protein